MLQSTFTRNPVLNVLSVVAISTVPTASAVDYTRIDYPGAQNTALTGGPNPHGTSVGYYNDNFGIIHGFILQEGKRGGFTTIDVPGGTFTVPASISPEGTIVGCYSDASFHEHGFVLSNGKYSTIDYPGAFQTCISGLAPSGEMTGSYCTDDCASVHGFIRSAKGVLTRLDVPGALSTQAGTVNPAGTVVGFYLDAAGVSHAFALRHGLYATIDFPGASATFGGANDPHGDVVGIWDDAVGVSHGFLLENGTFTSFDLPGSIGIINVSGINPRGTIVGGYVDSTGGHGFIREP